MEFEQAAILGILLTLRFVLLTMLNAVKKFPPVLSGNTVTVQNFNFALLTGVWMTVVVAVKM